MKRVNNPAKYLKGIVANGQTYYIGFGINELTELGNGHPDIKEMLVGLRQKVTISGKKGVLKENTLGKFVRKQPEAKTSIWKHIEYYSHKWEKIISYDREFSIWEKELLHKFDLQLTAKTTPQGELIFIFPQFIMVDEDSHYLRAGAAMNMSCALSKYFLMYDDKLQPIIPITKYEDRSLLPAGQQYRTVKEKLDTIEKILNSANNVEGAGNSYRFAVLKEHTPTDVTIGTGGFDGYLIFEFKQSNLLIFENLKTGNATFIFKLSGFDFNKFLDKQTASNEPSFIKRVIHENMETWEIQIGGMF